MRMVGVVVLGSCQTADRQTQADSQAGESPDAIHKDGDYELQSLDNLI